MSRTQISVAEKERASRRATRAPDRHQTDRIGKKERGSPHGPGRGRAAEPDPFAHPDPPTQRLPDFGFAGLGKRV